MSGLPRISGKDCAKVLEKFGFKFIRQHGSHIILRRENPFAQTTVPLHKEIDRGVHYEQFYDRQKSHQKNFLNLSNHFSINPNNI